MATYRQRRFYFTSCLIEIMTLGLLTSFIFLIIQTMAFSLDQFGGFAFNLRLTKKKLT